MPAAVTLPAGEPPELTPAPSPEPDALARMQANFDTMLGRLEAEREARLRAEAERDAQTQNNAFVSKRLQEAEDARRAEAEARRKLEADTAVALAAKGFQSDKVDPEQFAEIFRGLQPVFTDMRSRVETLAEENRRLNQTVDGLRTEGETRVQKVRQEILEKNLVRGAPEIKQLLKQPDFNDFLAQRVPGSRRTRLAELQEAYAEGDEDFIVGLVKDFKLQGKPAAVPSGDPPRAITQQTPRAAVKEEVVSDDQVQAAFQQYLDGKIPQSEYKRLRALNRKQSAGG